MVRAQNRGTKGGRLTDNPQVNPPKLNTTGTRSAPLQPTMQNTTTTTEKRMALIAAQEARLEAERQRAEEEKARAAAEALELAELEKMEEEEKKAKAEAERKAREEVARKKAEEMQRTAEEEAAKKKAEEAKKKAEEEAVKEKAQAMRLVTPADEEELVAALRRQGVEAPTLGAGPSTEGAEGCWACRKRNKECERRENKRQVKQTQE